MILADMWFCGMVERRTDLALRRDCDDGIQQLRRFCGEKQS
jgi:hypothetical protein